jgi:Protein of unknown function (DUF1549)/Protein of unknown function (DUF1553)
MANATERNPRLWWTGAVALSLLTFGGWQAQGQDHAKAKDQEKKHAEEKPSSPSLSTFVSYPQVKAINDQIAAQWKANNLTPSHHASDFEFIRRASLDIIGRIATPDEIKKFMDDPERTRRALLIERLLDSEEYAKNWANIWTVWLMTRSSNRTYQEQMQLWLEEQFAKKECKYDKIVYGLVTATGDNNDNGAVNYILANLGAPVAQPDVGEEGHFDFVPLTSRTTRLFLGLRTQCTQCHDHPFNPQWKQKSFWAINAFFRQVNRTGNPMMGQQMNTPVKLGLVDDGSVNPKGSIWFENRKAEVFFAKAAFLEKDKEGRAVKWDPESKLSRREQLAEFIIKSDYFPRAYVNRLWGHFFGRGFTNPGPVDDFGEHNPVTHPMLPDDLVAKLMKTSGPIPEDLAKEIKKYDEDKDHDHLLDYLAKEFRKYGHNPRDLIRWICNSEAYNLSSVANKTNEKSDAEPFFSRMLLKAMSPEQLFESLMTATLAEQAETKDGKKKLREEWMKNLIVNFGDDEGNEVTFNGTVVQALMLMNGKEINTAISHMDKGTVAMAWKKYGRNQARTLDLLYLAALNRLPTSKEISLISQRSKINSASDLKNPLAPWQDLFWALLNSNEFILNH